MLYVYPSCRRSLAGMLADGGSAVRTEQPLKQRSTHITKIGLLSIQMLKMYFIGFKRVFLVFLGIMMLNSTPNAVRNPRT